MKRINSTKYFSVVAVAALVSMLIARQELAQSFEFNRWLWLSVSVLSGPCYALAMMWGEKKTIVDIVFVVVIAIIALLPFVIALRRKSMLMFSIGASVWVFIGYVVAIAIYI